MGALIHRYRSVATSRAIHTLLEKMTAEERSQLHARLRAGNNTIEEYVGALLTAHERWDLVEWDEVTEEVDEASPATMAPHPDVAQNSSRSQSR